MKPHQNTGNVEGDTAAHCQGFDYAGYENELKKRAQVALDDYLLDRDGVHDLLAAVVCDGELMGMMVLAVATAKDGEPLRAIAELAAEKKAREELGE